MPCGHGGQTNLFTGLPLKLMENSVISAFQKRTQTEQYGDLESQCLGQEEYTERFGPVDLATPPLLLLIGQQIWRILSISNGKMEPR
jgi:hypothetical protein